MNVKTSIPGQIMIKARTSKHYTSPHRGRLTNTKHIDMIEGASQNLSSNSSTLRKVSIKLFKIIKERCFITKIQGIAMKMRKFDIS